jgi:cytochrome c oxidase subunit III
MPKPIHRPLVPTQKFEPKAMRSLIYARRNPYVLMLWLAMAGSAIIFALITVVYIVRVGGQRPTSFPLPDWFWLSTGLIAASSLSMLAARAALKQEQFARYTLWLGMTLILGLLFGMGQLVGWRQMLGQNIRLSNNVGGSFVYLLSGLHALHVVLGLAGLAWVFADALRHRQYVDGFIQTLNPVKASATRLVSLFWHFLGIVWLALFVCFLAVQH